MKFSIKDFFSKCDQICSHKMVRHTQTIRRLFPTNCLSVFDHFVTADLVTFAEEILNGKLYFLRSESIDTSIRNLKIDHHNLI